MKDFAGVLVSQWESTEEVYVESCKNVFGLIRRERELIHRYFYGVRLEVPFRSSNVLCNLGEETKPTMFLLS